MKNLVLLWLDDRRDPFDKEKDWLRYSPLKDSFETVWIKSAKDFKSWISKNGIPDAICFDHDLGIKGSGHDCAKWLVEYCLDNDEDLPMYEIQSSNPPGSENIRGLLESFKKHRNDELGIAK